MKPWRPFTRWLRSQANALRQAGLGRQIRQYRQRADFSAPAPTTPPAVLFVLDKWCEGNPAFGPSNHEHNFLGSLAATGLASATSFHFDQYYADHQRAGDLALLQLCQTRRPGLIVLCWLHGSRHNPHPETLRVLSQSARIPIVACWFDSVRPEVMAVANRLDPWVTLHVVLDSPTAYCSAARSPEKFLPLWTPQDPRLFTSHGQTRDLDICFAGTVAPNLPERARGLAALRQAGLAIHVAGGQRHQALPAPEYAARYQRAKIVVNFSRASNGQFQAKGRVFEALTAGAMVLEAENPAIAHWLRPGADYVPFVNDADLVAKARYYLTHESERLAIAEHGRATVTYRYSAARFWQTLFHRVGLKTGESA